MEDLPIERDVSSLKDVGSGVCFYEKNRHSGQNRVFIAPWDVPKVIEWLQKWLMERQET